MNPTPWGYSPYDEIIENWSPHGIPREQIAAIGDAESDAKKQALFEKVRQGSVRVLIGSTQKMGTGTNVQKRLVALHHLDAPWKPAEVEQRDGRILPPGQRKRGSGDLPLRHGRLVRRLYVAGPGDQGPVHRPGHHRRQRRPPRRGHRRPGTLLRRGQGDCIGQPGGADPRRGRRRTATARPPQEEPPRRAISSPAAACAICRTPSPACPRRLSNLTADQATATAHAGDPITIGSRTLLRDDVPAVLGGQLDSLPPRRPRDDPRAARHLSRPAFRPGPPSAIPARRVPRRCRSRGSPRSRGNTRGRVPS